MITGTAKVWKDAFINERKAQQDSCPGNNWAQFKALLEGSFTDPGQSKDAMQQLQTICQGKDPIDTMNTRFCLLLSKAFIFYSLYTVLRTSIQVAIRVKD